MSNRHFGRPKQAGFSLIEMLLALGIVILISGLVLTGIRRDNETAQAQAVGDQMKMVGNALNTYISMRYDVIVAHVPGTGDVGTPGTAADPGPRTCVNVATPFVGKRCTITSETLRRNSLVPNSFSGRNAFGANYVYEIHVSGSSPNWVVDGIVTTSAPYATGATVRYDLLGTAMLAAGADSGMVRTTATTAEGYNGAWAENTYSNINALGLLAYRAGYSSQGYAAYLRRDGSAPMTGQLDMNGNNIVGVANMDATGQITQKNSILTQVDGAAAGDGNAASALAFGPVATPNATIGVSGLGAAQRLRIRQTNGVRVENMAGAAGVLDAGDVNATNVNAVTSIISQGTLGVTGNGTINGSLEVGNPAIAAAAGGLTANGAIRSLASMQASTAVYVGSGTTASSLRPGAMYFNNTATPTGFVFNAATGNISMSQNPDLYTGGDIRSGTGHVDTTFQVGGGIVFNGSIQPAVGTACVASVATMANSTTGALVQCTNGIWTTMGLAPGSVVTSLAPTTVCTYRAPAAANPPSVATCPNSYQVTGGGYQFSSGPQRAAPIESRQNGTATWIVYAGLTDPYGTIGAGATSASDTCYKAYANCAR